MRAHRHKKTHWPVTLLESARITHSGVIACGSSNQPKVKVLASITLCLSIALTPTPPQAPEIAPTTMHYEAESWTIQDGLPQGGVTSVVQTSDGFIWAGTSGGLVRFDGLKFETFDLSNHPELRSNRITALCETRDGTLWIGTQNMGLVCYSAGEFTVFDEANFSGASVLTLFEDSSDRLWVGMGDSLAWIEGDRIQLLEDDQLEPSPLPLTNIMALGESPPGTLWIATWHHLLRWDGKLTVVAKNVTATSILSLRDGSVRIATRQGVNLLWRDGRLSESPSSSPHGVSSLLEDRRGSIWANGSNGVFRWHDGKLESPLAHAQLPPTDSRSSIEDREGSLWFGTSGGLWRVRQSPMRGFPLPPRLDGNSPKTVAMNGDGSLWCMLYTGQLVRFQDGSFEPATTGSQNRASALASAADGSLHIGGWWKDGNTPAWNETLNLINLDAHMLSFCFALFGK